VAADYLGPFFLNVFLTDALTCLKCQGRMKILAAITKPDAIRKILDHLEHSQIDRGLRASERRMSTLPTHLCDHPAFTQGTGRISFAVFGF
jgi:hypothetical protein